MRRGDCVGQKRTTYVVAHIKTPAKILHEVMPLYPRVVCYALVVWTEEHLINLYHFKPPLFILSPKVQHHAGKSTVQIHGNLMLVSKLDLGSISRLSHGQLIRYFPSLHACAIGIKDRS